MPCRSIESEQERKRAEEALKESEEKYRGFFETSQDIVFITSPEGAIFDVNPAFETILGYTREETLSRNVSYFYKDPHGAQSIQGDHRKTRFIKDFELTMRKKDGTYADCLMTAAARRDRKGAIVGYQGTIRDITERKEAEEAIKESEERYRGIFETSRDIIVVTNREARIIDINRAAEQLTGYTREELLSLDLTEVYSPSDERDRIIRLLAERGFVKDHEISFTRKDGQLLDCLMTAVVRKDKSGAIIGYQGFLKDITERKKMERQLAQAEKLSSLGGILSGVAHELNNPLTSIIGHADLMMRKEIPAHIREKLEIIRKESFRSSKIIQGLLAFAREHKPERKMISINDVIMESYRLREYELRVDNVVIQTDLSEDIPKTSADPYQLQQVFINLINNAHDALVTAGGGTLVIRSVLKNGAISIEFEDDGPGIPKDIINYIFDPFFTTKEVGKGTGLGLAIVYGIIGEHGGKIDVTSSPRKATRFSIELPVTSEEERTERPMQKKAAGPRNGKSVLVVEDEKSVRDLLFEALADEGHRVDLCTGGEEAIEAINGKRYDVVISDMKMPGIGGKELYTFIQKYHPGLSNRVLFITGDVLGKDTQAFLKITGSPFVEKPFQRRITHRAAGRAHRQVSL